MALAAVIRPLSGSSDMLPINVTATADGGTTIHTAFTSSLVLDKVWAWVTNTSTVSISLVIEWGPSANKIMEDIPPRVGRYDVLFGNPILGVSTGGSATVIKAHASSSQVLDIYGYVDRVTET